MMKDEGHGMQRPTFNLYRSSFITHPFILRLRAFA
jgi:hypothetical protein